MNIKARKAVPVFFFIAALLIPLFIKSTYIILLFNFMGLYMISVSGLDLLFGYTGQISLGHAAFYGLGAYTTAILTTRFSVPVIPAIIFSLIVAAFFGVLLAIPACKLVGHFLALLTIAFGQLFYQFVANFSSISGGFSGINFIPEISLFGMKLTTNVHYFYFILILVVAALYIKQAIVHSSYGRSLIAIRENIHAADGAGINVVSRKISVFAISAVFTALTGSIYACMVGFISPETFTQNQSIIFLTMLLLGGMGHFVGPLIGAVIVTIIKEYLQGFGTYQMLIYGLIIIVVVLFAPNGLVGLYGSVKARLGRKRRKTNA
ncbi:MAG: branched-chain amino acid ABC transporter permease [Ruminococcus sp.]